MVRHLLPGRAQPGAGGLLRQVPRRHGARLARRDGPPLAGLQLGLVQPLVLRARRPLRLAAAAGDAAGRADGGRVRGLWPGAGVQRQRGALHREEDPVRVRLPVPPRRHRLQDGAVQDGGEGAEQAGNTGIFLRKR